LARCRDKLANLSRRNETLLFRRFRRQTCAGLEARGDPRTCAHAYEYGWKKEQGHRAAKNGANYEDEK
jgi:hypothetical protein